MTRETKIGLLVGLAFIIVIGILLSDHLTSSTEPPPVTYTDAGPQVRKTVLSPGTVQNNAPVVVQQQVQPQQTVPTPRDMQAQTPTNEVVKIDVGPSIQFQGSPQRTQTPTVPTPIVAAQPERGTKFVDPQPIRASEGPTGTLARIANENGEPLVTTAPNGSEQKPAPVVVAQSDSNTREYIAQPGESLSKITAKVFGTSTKAGMDAIVALNPSLQQDRNKIIAGKPYRVPANGAAVTAAPAAQQPAPATAAPAPKQTASAGSTNDVWYTVKDGDTLTRIASEELGDPSAVQAIKDMNRDVLPNPDMLKVNMRIRLPGKPVAVAN